MLLWAVLSVGAVVADFNISMADVTTELKAGRNLTLPLIFQGSAQKHLCGCLFPPCGVHDTFNFTCANASAAGSIFSPPYPFRNSQVTSGPRDPDALIDITFSLTGMDVPSLGVWQTPTPTDPGPFHDPLREANVPPAPVTCKISSTSVTCDLVERGASVTCFMPGRYTSCPRTHNAASYTFPPCNNTNAPKQWCGSSSSQAAWFTNVYSAEMKRTYGDFNSLGISFASFADPNFAMVKIPCFATLPISEPPPDLSKDQCHLQHKRAGKAFCNNPVHCGNPDICASCAYSEDAKCYTPTKIYDFEYDPADVGGDIFGQVCFVPTISKSRFETSRTVSVPYYDDQKVAQTTLVTLRGENYAEELDFINFQYHKFSRTETELLEAVSLNLVHFQMAQTGMEPYSMSHLTVWTALYHLRGLGFDVTCFEPAAQLICAPVTQPITDECAAHAESVSNFFSGADTDTITSSVSPNKKSNEPAPLVTFHHSNIREEYLEFLQQSVVDDDGNVIDDPSIKQMFEKDTSFDTTSCHLSAHPVSVVCSTQGSSSDSTRVCASSTSEVQCPILVNGVDAFSSQISLANSSGNIFQSSTSLELFASCAYAKNPPPCEKTLLYTNELPIDRTATNANAECVADFALQHRFKDTVDYCSFLCASTTGCTAFFAYHASADARSNQCCLYRLFSVNKPLQNCDLALPSCPENVLVVEPSEGTGWFFSQTCSNAIVPPDFEYGDVECSFKITVQEFLGISVGTNPTNLRSPDLASTVAKIALKAVEDLDDLGCITPFHQLQCVQKSRKLVTDHGLGDFGSIFKIESTAENYVITHLQKGPTTEASCNQQKIRLTGEVQNQRGAVWHEEPQQILGGFSTEFTIQFSRPSTLCKTVKTLENKNQLYTHCTEVGADGLAFVIKGLDGPLDHNLFGTKGPRLGDQLLEHDILGAAGEGLGYAGIPNSVAIEFDTFFNDNGDTPFHHVSVHSFGVGNNTSTRSSLIASYSLSGPEYPQGFFDKKPHRVKVEYIPKLVMQNIYRSPTTFPHTLDLVTREGRYQPPTLSDEPFHPNQGGTYRYFSPDAGTMQVFLDDMEFPLFSFPIDLKNNLQLVNGTAAVGFTGATGRRWQNSYVLDWTFCEGECSQYIANKSSSCEPSTTTTDYSKLGFRNERRCQFWNSDTLWDRGQTRVLPHWVDRASVVDTDPTFVSPTPTPSPYYQNPLWLHLSKLQAKSGNN